MENKDYTKQMNRAVDYIHQHLDRSIAVEELAERAALSPFHFHRVFLLVIGETPGKYIRRKRLERAANLLFSPDLQVKDVADACGYSSVALFCRSFKQHWGMTSEEFRSRNCKEESRNSQFKSINEHHTSLYSRYFCREKIIKIGEKMMNCIFELKELPAVDIIYCRHQGALDQMQGAFARLMQWAYPRGLVIAPGMKLVSVYHDDPRITTKDKLTADAGMIVTQAVKVDGEIGKYTISGGKYAVGAFEISMDEFSAAWGVMFDLITENGCACTDGYHYEIYQNNHDDHPEKKFVVDICIPVRAVRQK